MMDTVLPITTYQRTHYATRLLPGEEKLDNSLTPSDLRMDEEEEETSSYREQNGSGLVDTVIKNRESEV